MVVAGNAIAKASSPPTQYSIDTRSGSNYRETTNLRADVARSTCSFSLSHLEKEFSALGFSYFLIPLDEWLNDG